ncbi:receptor-type tyrosine-protein phosphatase mu-like [Haemaphysalis longicornis]
MCLPDPYGCSCGTGFHGPFCNETCPPHTYGADCKQSRICFCKTAPFCDIYSGTCRQDRGMCRQGWRNAPFCDTSYPLFKSKPSVTGITEKEATIEFKAWTKNVDDGEGDPQEYRVEYKVANETWSTHFVRAINETWRYAVFLNGLRIGTDYEVRVLVVDKDGNYREDGASSSRFQTACGTPTMPPQNIMIDSNSTTEILVKWKNPVREQWLCWSASVVLEIDGNSLEFNLTQSGFPSVEQHRIPVKPYTSVGIRLALKTPNNKYSQWTTKQTVTSAEDAPGAPFNLTLTEQTEDSLKIEWEPPMQSNGLLREYQVHQRIAHTFIAMLPESRHSTTITLPASQKPEIYLRGLFPGSTYEVCTKASTIAGFGKAACGNFSTKASGFLNSS